MTSTTANHRHARLHGLGLISLFALVLLLVNVLEAGAATSAPSQAPSTNATLAPTPVPLPLNSNDRSAFMQLTVNLARSGWRECNRDADPCQVCSQNTPNHAVDCSVLPVAGQSGQFERRITGMRFRNLNIRGSVDDFVLFAFTALRTVDISSNRSLPFGNRIRPPSGRSCVEIPLCNAEGASCNFGVVAPLCSSLPVTFAPTPVQEPVGTYIGIAFGAIGGVALLSLGLLYYSQRQSRKRAREEKQRAKERKRRKLMREGGGDGDDDSVYSRATAMSVGSLGGPPPGPPPGAAPPPNRKSFSTLRTRKQKELQKQAQQGALAVGAMIPQGPGWTQQVDPSTGAPYYFNTMTGESRMAATMGSMSGGGDPSLPRAGSSKKLIVKGSSKKLVKKASSKQLARTGSKLIKKGSSRSMAAAPPPMAVGPYAGVGSEWEETFDPTTNSVYWVNRVTGAFSWTNPL